MNTSSRWNVDRGHVDGPFSREELALANRNPGLPLEALDYDVTPIGLHYQLNHFDIPHIEPAAWRLTVEGAVRDPLRLTLDDIRRLPSLSAKVTIECAGNGRALIRPRHRGMPWTCEAVGTAEWTGAPLRLVLEQAGLAASAVEVAFLGVDRGIDKTGEHAYGRSLGAAHALAEEVLLCYAMNGAPLPPQHGAPLRLVVPGWYGMASVKWLERIEVLERPFDGPEQTVGYHFRRHADDPGEPVEAMRVRSLIRPPGIPDFYTRNRIVEAGRVALSGRAWSGAGLGIARVEVAVDGDWREARLDAPVGRFAWRGWRLDWDATPGEHELAARATDTAGNRQPLEPVWDHEGFGNNCVHRIRVLVT